MGILLGMRMHSASESALEIYSPKAETTITKEQDEISFLEHWGKSDAIRAKYDPGNEWNEYTIIPQEYLDECRKLNLEYQGVLRRRNGWTDSDFDN